MKKIRNLINELQKDKIKRNRFILLYLSISVLISLVLFFILSEKNPLDFLPIPVLPQKYYIANLYYPDHRSQELKIEKRRVYFKETGINKIKATINELLVGPINENLINCFPDNLVLRNLWLSGNTLYANFNSVITNASENGMNDEINCIFSIVKSICRNFFSIQSVQFLIDGQVKNTLRGHLDISHPITFNDDIYTRFQGSLLLSEEKLLENDKRVESLKQEVLNIDFE